MKTYKELVQAIIDTADEQGFSETCGKIDMAYQAEKISFKDHEQLYELLSLAAHGKGIN